MKILNLAEELRSNAYPGRGIVLGRSADNKCAVIAYFIMGRSENSRNRVFTEKESEIKTEPFDVSKVEDCGKKEQRFFRVEKATAERPKTRTKKRPFSER